MSLTVLSDDDIRDILESLTSSETEELADSMRGALREYSTGTQNIDAGLVHQPDRTVVHSEATNATNLFMPSINADGHAVKGKSEIYVLPFLDRVLHITGNMGFYLNYQPRINDH